MSAEPELCRPPGHAVDDLAAFTRLLTSESREERLEAAWLWGVLSAIDSSTDRWERALLSLAKRKRTEGPFVPVREPGLPDVNR
jgi:hypothetical protein